MRKITMALSLFLILVSCAKKEPSVEQKLSSPEGKAVLSGLSDMWRAGDAVNMASAAALLDKKEFGEDAAFALSGIASPAVNNLVLSGMEDGKDNDARLLYFCLAFKDNPTDEFIASRAMSHYAKYKGRAHTAINLVTGNESMALKAAASFEKEKIFLDKRLSREFILKIGEKRYGLLYNFLESVYLTHRELRPFAEMGHAQDKKGRRHNNELQRQGH